VGGEFEEKRRRWLQRADKSLDKSGKMFEPPVQKPNSKTVREGGGVSVTVHPRSQETSSFLGWY
jgi:hypothetical protein